MPAGSRILLLAVLGLAALPTASLRVRAEPDLAWRLGLSDLALYDRRTLTVKNGKERRGRATPHTVHGHDLRREGQYRPLSPGRADLPAILAMRLPPPGTSDDKLALAKIVRIRMKLESSRTAGKDGVVAIDTSVTFGSRGRARKTDTHWIRDGKARIRSTFDPEQGVLVRSRVDVSYALGKTHTKPGERSKRVTIARTYALRRVQRARYGAFQKDVDDAIDKGVKKLRELQKDDGSFPPHGNWTIGTTALAVLTLASCDVPRDDPAVEEGLAFICDASPTRTYALALALMALDRAYTPPGEVLVEHRRRLETFRRDLPADRRAWAERATTALESAASSPGTWSYPQMNRRALLKFDSSNTQYGVLGLRAAHRLGIPVKDSVWTGVVRYFGQVRERGGERGSVHLVRRGEAVPGDTASAAGEPVPEVAGFRYGTLEGHRNPWASMTCAGIASLSIARDQLIRMRSRRLDPTMEREIHEMIVGGWAWLDAHWAMDRHPEKPGTSRYLYYLYSLERAGVLSGVDRVGGKDWYFEGAVQLIARQKKNGEWKEGGDAVGTCFALLFLKRATAPITPSSPR